MSDHPILFSSEMIRALLAGQKTMTRRMLYSTRQMKGNLVPGNVQFLIDHPPPITAPDSYPALSNWAKVKPGDRLWVREMIRHAGGGRNSWVYAADHEPVEVPQDRVGEVIQWARAQKRERIPSIHMPRLFSRITLEVTGNKIEPLLDISEDDAKAEGFAAGQLDDGFGPRDIGGGWTIKSPGTFASAVGHFQVTWAKLHPEWDGYSSPEVIAISFNVIRNNVDRIAA